MKISTVLENTTKGTNLLLHISANISGYIGWRNRFLGIDSCVGNFSPAMGARNQVSIGLSVQEPSLELSSQAT
jgi:hypothetical protein